jgi:hypothetical protein
MTETLRERILRALTPADRRVRGGNIRDRESDAESRHGEDMHRLSAHGLVDLELEAGRISPDEAERRKTRWDVMHGY